MMLWLISGWKGRYGGSWDGRNWVGHRRLCARISGIESLSRRNSRLSDLMPKSHPEVLSRWLMRFTQRPLTRKRLSVSKSPRLYTIITLSTCVGLSSHQQSCSQDSSSDLLSLCKQSPLFPQFCQEHSSSLHASLTRPSRRP